MPNPLAFADAIPPPDKTRFWTRPDGGTLAWDEYGDPMGKPLLFCHGWPSCRLQARMMHGEALACGLRVIAPDRPGVGLSTLTKNRTLLDWPPLMQSFFDHLGVEKSYILGISGGGPYVLAMAAEAKDRILGAGVLCGAVPLADFSDHSKMLIAYRMLMPLRNAPPCFFTPLFGIARWMTTLNPSRPPFSLIMKMVPEVDRKAITIHPKSQEAFLGSFREAFAQGTAGVMADSDVYFQNWKIDYTKIRTPIHFWHGEKDGNIPVSMARQHVARLPAAEITIYPDMGHFSITLERMNEALDKLIMKP